MSSSLNTCVQFGITCRVVVPARTDRRTDGRTDGLTHGPLRGFVLDYVLTSEALLFTPSRGKRQPALRQCGLQDRLARLRSAVSARQQESIAGCRLG
jgi:hypothetical protein